MPSHGAESTDELRRRQGTWGRSSLRTPRRPSRWSVGLGWRLPVPPSMPWQAFGLPARRDAGGARY
eukprot:3548618-Pyramimonas_sp.AAC.1